MRHKLKTWKEPFRALALGIKTYEIRKEGDRVFTPGDILVLQEWIPESESYTGHTIEAHVAYLTRGPAWDIPVGMVVMSLVNISKVFYQPQAQEPIVIDVFKESLKSFSKVGGMQLAFHLLGVHVPNSVVDTWTQEEKLAAHAWAKTALVNLFQVSSEVTPPVPPHVEIWMRDKK